MVNEHLPGHKPDLLGQVVTKEAQYCIVRVNGENVPYKYERFRYAPSALLFNTTSEDVTYERIPSLINVRLRVRLYLGFERGCWCRRTQRAGEGRVKNEPLSASLCVVCGERVADHERAAHLTGKHPGPHVFHYDGREHSTDKPSMTVGELLRMVGGPAAYSFFEEREGGDVSLAHANAVDLTRRPRFYSVPPAAM